MKISKGFDQHDETPMSANSGVCIDQHVITGFGVRGDVERFRRVEVQCQPPAPPVSHPKTCYRANVPRPL